MGDRKDNADMSNSNSGKAAFWKISVVTQDESLRLAAGTSGSIALGLVVVLAKYFPRCTITKVHKFHSSVFSIRTTVYIKRLPQNY